MSEQAPLTAFGLACQPDIVPGTVDGCQIERLAPPIFEEGVRKAGVWLDR